MSIQICIGLTDAVLLPKILGNRLGILTSVLIAMDYFFRCQKSTFNLQNNKCICQGNFLSRKCLPTLLKKQTLVQMFSCEFFKISQNTIFTEHLWATVSVIFLLQNYFSNYVHLKDIYKTVKVIGNIQFVSELTILLNLYISKFQKSLRTKNELIKV